MLGRRCSTIDIDPIYGEIAIRRLEHFRVTGKTGWQNGNPFEREILGDGELQLMLNQQQEMKAEGR
jgi:site-specific DNA-methyltransferase (adenine-specific)